MPSTLLNAKSYVAAAALASAAAGFGSVSPAHAAAGAPPRPPHAGPRTPLALTPKSSRIRAERADGRLTLTFV